MRTLSVPRNDGELILARMIASIALFCAVALVAAAFTVLGFRYSTAVVAQLAAAAPVRTDNLKPRYEPRFALAKAADLDVARSVPVKPVAQALPPEAALQPAPGFTHSVTVEALRVRSGPGRTQPQVFTLKGGTWVNISDNVRGWVRITDQAGKTGWVYGSLLRPLDTAQVQAR